MYETFGKPEFDFIVEDGSHVPYHQLTTLASVFPYLKSGGIYFLEDMSVAGRQVCCIRNDETYECIKKFATTGIIDTPHITESEKEYLEQNVASIEFFTDIVDGYEIAAIYKK